MKKNLQKLTAISISFAMAITLIPASANKASAYTRGNYRYFNDYTIGYNNGIRVYKNGNSYSVDESGVKVYNKQSDRPFASEINQAWDTSELVLTAPVKYTGNDGKAHDVESMLTNFDFIADPTAIDNSENDGKIYVYGTTEGFSYKNGMLNSNAYANHSLTILSSSDMVNWTDEGFMDSLNLTNEPSNSSNKKKSGLTSGNSWAPSGLKIDGDGDGKDEYYLFYTNGGATGYVMSDSPTGPWKDPLGKALCSGSLPNCSDCNTCFDPGVLADDKGNAYVYFGGLSRTSGRVVKIKFEPGTGKVKLDGDPVKMPTYAFFEDNEINQFNGKYYYSYCSDWSSQPLTNIASICAYVGSDPLKIAFDPTSRPAGQEKQAFTDSDGTYHHFLGTILNNPSVIYGQTYNNHHHMQEFKVHNYIFYHSTVLNNTIHRDSKNYRNLHVDEINIDKETDNISITPSYEGAAQIEDFDPYKEFDGTQKTINATTTSYSAGVCSRRSDSRVKAGLSPMVLDEIDTGDWTKIQGVNFDRLAAKFEAEVASTTDKGAIEVYLDDPTKASNYVCSVNVKNTGSKENFTTVSTDITSAVGGKHDVYFVFRGTDYNVASWRFTGSGDPLPTAVPATPAPTIVPAATPAPGSEHKFDIANDNYYVEGGDGVRVIKNDDNTVTLKFTKQYSAVDMYLPENSDFYNNCKSVVITYKLSGNVKKSDGTPDSNLGHALFDKDCVPNPSGYGDASKGKHVDWGQKLAVTDTYVTKVFRVGNDFSGNCVNGIQIFNPHTMSSGNEINITIKSVRFYPDEKADNFVPSEDDPAKTPAPTKAPDVAPTKAPDVAPTKAPDVAPTKAPDAVPTKAPDVAPTKAPDVAPTKAPEAEPTKVPKAEPTKAPDVAPTKAPEAEPTKAPEAASTKAPEAKPTTTPTISTINNVENLKKTYLIGKLKYKMMDSRYVAVTGVEKKNIKAVSVPATVKISGKTYKVAYIAAGAFKNCKKLKNVTIGKNVRSIGSKAFSKCKTLKKITVKSKLIKLLAKNAFSGAGKKIVYKFPKSKARAYKKLFAGKK